MIQTQAAQQSAENTKKAAQYQDLSHVAVCGNVEQVMPRNLRNIHLTAESGHDFTQARVRPNAAPVGRDYGAVSCPMFPRTCRFGCACHTCLARVQAKLAINQPGDECEQEADQVADQVMQMKRAEGNKSGETGSHSARHYAGAQIQRGSSLGKPLDIGTNEEMSRRIGVDFSNVRIHTEEPAVYLNKRLNARALTYGSDIFFNKGEYDPHSSYGKMLLAHELAHVVQQAGEMKDIMRQQMIQRTAIGQVLDEFFSPFSGETLWVMHESDNYTQIARTWQPVIEAVNRAKTNLEANCTSWSANHRTDSSWNPGMTDPPVTDPNAHREFVPSPPGTDPDTCRNAFIIYVTTKANLGMPTIQTLELYTCSIGSFNIYATVDSIDCVAGTSRMNIWMYNAMSRRSFGGYASHPLFRLSGMEKQYMWWNWRESHNWSPPSTTPAPVPPVVAPPARSVGMITVDPRLGGLATLREAPSLSGQTLADLPVGTQVVILDNSRPWIQVEVDTSQPGVILNAYSRRLRDAAGKLQGYVSRELIRR